jgi:hypothetical protein
MVDCGRGYGVTTPSHLGPLCTAFYFRPSSPEALHIKRRERHLLVKDGITGKKWPVNLACDSDSHVNHRGLLHATNLRHGTNGFTSPPKEGMRRIFFTRKIRQLRPGSNTRSWVPEASMITTRPSKPLTQNITYRKLHIN